MVDASEGHPTPRKPCTCHCRAEAYKVTFRVGIQGGMRGGESGILAGTFLNSEVMVASGRESEVEVRLLREKERQPALVALDFDAACRRTGIHRSTRLRALMVWLASCSPVAAATFRPVGVTSVRKSYILEDSDNHARGDQFDFPATAPCIRAVRRDHCRVTGPSLSGRIRLAKCRIRAEKRAHPVRHLLWKPLCYRLLLRNGLTY